MDLTCGGRGHLVDLALVCVQDPGTGVVGVRVATLMIGGLVPRSTGGGADTMAGRTWLDHVPAAPPHLPWQALVMMLRSAAGKLPHLPMSPRS